MAGRTERVYRWILDGLDARAILPGTVLDEVDLTDAHDMSRTPVREALLRLVLTCSASAGRGMGLGAVFGQSGLPERREGRRKWALALRP